MLIFWACNPKISQTTKYGPCKIIETKRTDCDRIDTIALNVASLPNNEYKLPIKCNQVIFNPSDDKKYNDLVRQYLISNCFEVINICPCEPPFELWENFTTDGVTVGVIIARAPKMEATDYPLIPNIVSQIPNISNGVNDSDSYDNDSISCKSISDSVVIAVIDTGIDSTIINRLENQLINRQWFPHHIIENYCGLPSNTFRPNNPLGLRFVENQFNNSVSDLNGHGTGVNFVAAGLSFPNVNSDIRLKFINVKTTTGTSKTGDLYDALCGINYACKQFPKIVNISWGFKFYENSSDPNIGLGLKKAFAKIFNQNNKVLFIAAAGNDGMELTTKQKFYPASASKFCSNVLAVGAIIENNNAVEICSFSNYQRTPGSNFIYTYGQNIKIRQFGILNSGEDSRFRSINQTYVIQSGTSLAAPLLSRMAGIISATRRDISGEDLRNVLYNKAQVRSTLISNVKLKYFDVHSIQKYCNELN